MLKYISRTLIKKLIERVGVRRNCERGVKLVSLAG